MNMTIKVTHDHLRLAIGSNANTRTRTCALALAISEALQGTVECAYGCGRLVGTPDWFAYNDAGRKVEALFDAGEYDELAARLPIAVELYGGNIK
jgi:hypothetical protein